MARYDGRRHQVRPGGRIHGMTERPGPDDLALPDPVDDYFSLVTLLSSVVPVFGGAVGHVFSEWAAARRTERLRDVLTGVVEKISALGTRVQDDYIRSEEFEDLLDQTLRRVANERHESKRRLYREFLVSAISSPAPYDEQLRVVRILEELQAVHIALIRAIAQEPDPIRSSHGTGSFAATLRRRMSGVSMEIIEELIALLNSMRITKLENIKSMGTAHGSEDLRHTITLFGRRFVEYIRAANP